MMTSTEAEKIIEKFHKSINDLRPDAIVQSDKELPSTSARIKYAHFVYGEELVKKVEVTEKIFQGLMESYGIINSFFSEDSESVNIKYRDYLEGLRSDIITDFYMPNPFGECEPVMEYYNFIGECLLHRHRIDLLTDNALGAFIYDALRKKATEEKDIKSLIKIVNTVKTRSVDFPDKKTNKESVFIK